MGEERAVLFQTDPPYAVGYTGGSHPATRANRGKANRNKDWSGQYREAAPSPDIESNSEIGREFYLKFIMAAIERAIAPERCLVLLARVARGRRCSRASGTRSAPSCTSRSSG